jgi:hypothetical protein
VLLGTDADSAVRSGARVVAALVGLLLCASWLTVQARHDAYIRFRRLQLRELEQELGFSTFTRAYDIFHRGESLEFAQGPEFHLAGREARSASAAEARLPLVLVALWTLGLVGATTGLIVAVI